MMTQPTENRIRLNGLEICYFEWPGTGPAIFFAHATGFHARCWDQIIKRLPGRHAIAIDMRGHGRSERPDPSTVEWRQFGEDVAELAKALKFEGAIGVGHSMGGHSVTLAAALVPGAFAGLLLVDPVILSEETYARRQRPEGTEHFAARRRNQWASVEEMVERFSGRGNFANWDPATLRDYCQYGLLPSSTGDGFELACPPAFEGATYMMSSGSDIHSQMAKLQIPVRIIRARQRTSEIAADFSSSPTDPDLWKSFPQATDRELPELSHFIPMEAPALVADEIGALVAQVTVPAK